jgi:hypothetical protein
MYNDVVVLKPHHLQTTMLLVFFSASPPRGLWILLSKHFSYDGPDQWNAAKATVMAVAGDEFFLHGCSRIPRFEAIGFG